MKLIVVIGALLCACYGAIAWDSSVALAGSARAWNPQAAAAYLDARQDWWMNWPNARRDHETSCVSCHTAVPYALARPALRTLLGEVGASPTERRLLDNVTTRVRMWKEVEPFYPDQTRGLPKTSESRGTEAILNALILSNRDAPTGMLSADASAAFENMWALQFKTGEQAGAWAWLNFHYEPWESADATYFGATLAAVAIGIAPANYGSAPALKDRSSALAQYLLRTMEKQPLFNRVMLLWASSRWPGLLSADERRGLVDGVAPSQQPDGGWSLASLGSWKRSDGTPLDQASDGYATGLITFALLEAGVSPTEPSVSRGLAWLAQHQNPSDGKWLASSLNKQRDPASDAARFMSDAATAFAVLALTDEQGGRK
jgi:squalene-hopene/tetraprenyl-beta-curcumene cyclase